MMNEIIRHFDMNGLKVDQNVTENHPITITVMLNSGVVTTVAEMTGEEVKCEECYVVISSYSSLKHG